MEYYDSRDQQLFQIEKFDITSSEFSRSHISYDNTICIKYIGCDDINRYLVNKYQKMYNLRNGRTYLKSDYSSDAYIIHGDRVLKLFNIQLLTISNDGDYGDNEFELNFDYKHLSNVSDLDNDDDIWGILIKRKREKTLNTLLEK